MGGFSGTVEGKTKLAAWLAFKRMLNRTQDGEADHPRYVTYKGGFSLIFPRRKREAYSRMEAKPDGTGWILRYHFHS